MMNVMKGFIVLLLLMFSGKTSAQKINSLGEIYQLREYKLQSKYQDEFISNFKNYTMPIMQKYGFNVLSTWINASAFYYLIKWKNENAMQHQWELFKSDKEWTRQKSLFQQQYGNVVVEINEHILTDMFSINSNDENSSGFVKFSIGDIECFTLSDGFVSLPVQPSLAPNVSSKIISEELRSNFRNDSIIDYPINILLLRKDAHLILVDAGQGSTINKDAGKLIGYLQSTGIHPSQITDIVISHAHTDHIDGLIDANGNSIYKNANIHISRIEYEFWKGIYNDFGK